jgi:hypothetical protein
LLGYMIRCHIRAGSVLPQSIWIERVSIPSKSKSTQFISIPSNPYGLKITEQALSGISVLNCWRKDRSV